MPDRLELPDPEIIVPEPDPALLQAIEISMRAAAVLAGHAGAYAALNQVLAR